MTKSSRQVDRRYESVGNEVLTREENTLTKAAGISGLAPAPISNKRKLEIMSRLYSKEESSFEKEIHLKHISEATFNKSIIIGNDDRIKAVESEYPYNSVCLLIIKDADGKAYFGTGFFISKKCVITSGHCVFINGNWAEEIEVIPGAKGLTKPYGSAVSKRFRSVTGWTDEKNRNFDHGAIILGDDSLYHHVNSFFGYRASADERSVELSGYPKDKNGTQWLSRGEIKQKSKYRLYYDLDTVIGNSGSPVYITEGTSRIVVGVHSFGDNPNFSIRVNQDVVNRWSEWSRL